MEDKLAPLNIRLFTEEDRPRKVKEKEGPSIPEDVKMFNKGERKLVQGMNLTRNHSGKFLTKLSKFIDGKKNNTSKNDKFKPNDDMKNTPGEVNRQIRTTMAQLVNKTYADYTPDRDMHTIG